MMAVETFVYLYILGFGAAALVAVTLLVAAARKISHDRPIEPGPNVEEEIDEETLGEWSD